MRRDEGEEQRRSEKIENRMGNKLAEKWNRKHHGKRR